MPVYIVTGKLGSGKTLCAVARMREYMERGVPIATNLDIHLHHMWGKDQKNINLMRIPDQPTIHDLEAIGYGNKSYDESLNGALLLDECGTWFNARNWGDKARKEVNDWFLHARKLGWDVFLIIQDVEILDSQARKAIAELTVFCRRLDRVGVPIFGALVKAIYGKTWTLPKVHVATAYYGTTRTDLKSETWTYRGKNHYRSYDTKQMFRTLPDDDPAYFGTHCLLTPWHLFGRYRRPFTLETLMRLTKIHWKRFQAPAYLAAALFAGVVVSTLAWPYMVASMQLKRDMALEAVHVEQEAALVAEPSPEATSEPVEPVTVAGTFADYTVIAHVRNARSQYYLISKPDGLQFTDSQLVSMGYRVFFVNECELMIAAAADMADKVSVFSPGCTPRPPGREMVDISTWPSMHEPVQWLVPTKPSSLNSLTVNSNDRAAPTL